MRKPDESVFTWLINKVSFLSHKKASQTDEKSRLTLLLDALASGQGKRFDPAVDEALRDLRENAALDEIVQARLGDTTSADLSLFCVSFLFDRSQNPAELVEPMLAIVESRGPSQVREAAESSILASCERVPQLLDRHLVERIVVRLPSVVNELRAFGSTLRIIERAGSLGRTAQPYLLEIYADFKKRNGHRPELDSILDMMNAILAV